MASIIKLKNRDYINFIAITGIVRLNRAGGFSDQTNASIDVSF